MTKLSYDAAWADVTAMARTNASILVILAGCFLMLPNFAQMLFAPPPVVKGFDMNMIKAYNEYFTENGVTLFLCNLPVWLGTAAIFSLLVDDRHLTVGEALKGALILLPSVIALNILFQLAFLGGLFLFIIPGLYLIGRLGMASPAQMGERIANPFAALKRSLAMTRGNGWLVAGLVILVSIVTMIAASAANSIIGIVLKLLLPQTMLGVGLGLLNSVIGAITALILILLSAAVYRQLKTNA